MGGLLAWTSAVSPSMQNHGLHRLRPPWRSPRVLPMMAQDVVQQLQSESRREVGDLFDLFVNKEHALSDMTQQPPCIRVIEPAFPREFTDLAHIMEDRAGEEQLPIDDPSVMGGDGLAQPHHRYGVLQQPSEVRVVKLLGRRGGGKGLAKAFRVKDAREEMLERLRRARADRAGAGRRRR